MPAPPPDCRLSAVRCRDATMDGRFVFSVSTTGIYCRPSCGARPARVEHIAFHATPAEAERAGFRPCKRCRPHEPPRAAREVALITAACRAIEAADEPPASAGLAAHAGLSPAHFQRLFRRIAGVTPRAYAAAQRQGRVQRGLAAGAPVTAAMYQAGFNSSGRFYEAAGAMLGMTPSRYRAGGPGEAVGTATGSSTLGAVLVAATTRGICAILLGDSAAALQADLRARLPRADITADPALAAALAQAVSLVDDPAQPFALPLDIRGTAFQRRVWEALQAIPAGQTRSYGAVAHSLGAPGSARAVAAACAANPLAIAVPCHRVVANDGSLAGYRWGLPRKRALLDRERG